MANEMWRQVLDTYNKNGLQTTFIETLGWRAPQKPSLKISVENEVITVSVIAQLAGAAVIEVNEETKPSTQWHKKVDLELKKHFSERLTRFSNESGDSWYWPKKLASGALSYDRLETKHQKLPDFLAQRLAGLHFSAKDHITPGKISPNEVRNRIRGQFESSKVTTDFFKKFKEKHEFLKSEIKGLPDEQTASSYSTLILNRLMFVYFLQKKEFLNNDPNYLKNCLRKVQSLKGKDKFYSFYRDYLLELFFNRLDKNNGKVEDPEIADILGDIPYVNGGVFSQSESERDFSIDIPDNAFEQIFEFFDSYAWHLDTRPTGVPNEINPEVIGYIFEQYINFTAAGKKENGAYYTTHDVTGFMASQALIPRLVDEFAALGFDPFADLLKSPGKYVYESMRHGFDLELGKWVEVPDALRDCWSSDPSDWVKLDQADHDSASCLPDETWVEMFHRRERVDSMIGQISAGGVTSVNSLIDSNLNALDLLADSIGNISQVEQVENLWGRVSKISIIDPTCGSGAFLFAALEILEEVYAKLLDRIEDLGSKSEILASVNKHPNRRYFLRKHAALRNLYGTDIMQDAIETAKLRIFLSLVSCLDTKQQIEPLPDLDFNLRVGNLLVGFKDSSDLARVDKGMFALENPLQDVDKSLGEYVLLHEKFVEDSSSNSTELAKSKSKLKMVYGELKDLVDFFFAECSGVPFSEVDTWRSRAKPMHWIVEFPRIVSSGGFDVVLGNPPYIARSNFSKEELAELSGYECYDFRDLYLVCYERALMLLNTLGRMSFIVPLSMSFGSTANRLRGVISKRGLAEWWSTYGLLPARLFSGAGVRNTILSLGPGDSVHSTHLQIFSAASRSWLFQNLEFMRAKRELTNPPVRAGVAQELGEFLDTLSEPTWKEDGEEVFFRPTANYWVPVLPKRPAIFSSTGKNLGPDPRVQTLRLSVDEDKVLALAILGGKLGYFYWGSVGDDFDVNARELLPPRILVSRASTDSTMEELAADVQDGISLATMRSNYAGHAYINIRWVSLRDRTDKFDKYVLEKLGLGIHWRALNIWYRQSMRSNDARVASGIISPEEAKAVWS
jgi:type I restriction-modification system DNA methylase subunit